MLQSRTTDPTGCIRLTSGTSFTIENAEELIRLLSHTDIRVPARGLGRTKEHTQTWSIARFLATFARTDLLRFPLGVTSCDRPDFVLARGNAEAGLEVTEAIHEDHARIDALRNIKGYSEPMLLQRLRPGDGRKTLSEIEAIARGGLDSAGWGGESVEADWSQAMWHVIQGKIERFRQPGFRKFAENWLLIYDNWSLPFLNRPRAARLLSTELAQASEPLPFDRVFIETGSSIFEYQGARYSHWPLNDLWRITTPGI